jgi:hypothetical protein
MRTSITVLAAISSAFLLFLLPWAAYAGSGATGKFDDTCGAGEFLVGLQVRSGLWIDKLRIVCAPFHADGNRGPLNSKFASHGGFGGEESEQLCPPTAAIISAENSYTHAPLNAIASLKFVCAAPSIHFTTEASLAFGNFKKSNPPVGASFEIANSVVQCPKGEFANGMTGSYGQYVHSASLKCAKFQLATAYCEPGTVYRDRYNGDGVCVTPDKRWIMEDGSCRQGYVHGLRARSTECWTSDQLAKAKQADFDHDAGLRSDGETSGKSADECIASAKRCKKRAKYYEHLNAPDAVVQFNTAIAKCDDISGTCQANANAAVTAAAAEFKKVRTEEIAVTGKTAAQCTASRDSCAARLKQILGPLQGEIQSGKDCLPYFSQCMANAAADVAKSEPSIPPTGDAQTAADVNATDVYPDNSGNSQAICTMNPGDNAKFVAAKPDEPRWINLSGITGECDGKSGWLWKGDNGEDVNVH